MSEATSGVGCTQIVGHGQNVRHGVDQKANDLSSIWATMMT